MCVVGVIHHGCYEEEDRPEEQTAMDVHAGPTPGYHIYHQDLSTH